MLMGLCGGVLTNSSMAVGVWPSVLVAVMLSGASLYRFRGNLIAGAVDDSVKASYVVAEKSIREYKPDVIVGFSWGGALTCEAIRRQEWHGPTVLLAPAHHKLHELRNPTSNNKPPPNVSLPQPTTIVHSRADTLVNISCSRELMQGSANQHGVKLIEIDNDPHAMWSIAKDGSLANIVYDVGQHTR
jgi:dienelactone hydrolase